MSQAWLAQRERGTLAALRLISWITHRVGYRAARALLHPICVYFIVFSGPARRASRNFLSRILGRAPAWAEIYRHYHTFAASILDRVLLAAGRIDEFTLEVQGEDVVSQALREGRGALLLGSHLGSFELCRAAGRAHRGLVINVVMHEANAGKIATWVKEAAPHEAPKVIIPGRPQTMLEIRDALLRSEVVAMLGDRPIGHSPTLEVDFLGAPARLPTGPLRVALALDVPVVTFFGLYRGPRCYDLYFETLPVPALGSQASRTESLVRAYAARLESYTRTAPFNWFNFYNYWERA